MHGWIDTSIDRQTDNNYLYGPSPFQSISLGNFHFFLPKQLSFLFHHRNFYLELKASRPWGTTLLAHALSLGVLPAGHGHLGNMPSREGRSSNWPGIAWGIALSVPGLQSVSLPCLFFIHCLSSCSLHLYSSESLFPIPGFHSSLIPPGP